MSARDETKNHPRHVRFDKRGVAAWIVLDRPQKRNALSPAMIEQLPEALDAAEGDPQVRAVVLTGAGTAFCAGADLDLGEELARGDVRQNPFADLLQRLRLFPKPVIAAVNGPTFGGGLGLVASADIALASSAAVFSFSEVRLGLVPAMISVVVLPKLGSHHARRLFLTGRRFSADEAVHYGLLHAVTPPGALRSAVEKEVADVAKGGPEAVVAAKQLLREIASLPKDEAFARASEIFAERLRSDEAHEGMSAFGEKRRPRWRE